MPNVRERILEFRIQTLRDKEAFGEFHQIHRPSIFRFILSRTQSTEIAEDLTSEVFIKACQYIFEDKRPVTHLRGLLFIMAKGCLHDHFRRIKNREVQLSPDDLAFTNLPDDQASASHLAELGAERKNILKHLEKLPASYREVIALKFFDEMNIEEISAILGKSQGAIRVLLHRALRDLKKNWKI